MENLANANTAYTGGGSVISSGANQLQLIIASEYASAFTAFTVGGRGSANEKFRIGASAITAGVALTSTSDGGSDLGSTTKQFLNTYSGNYHTTTGGYKIYNSNYSASYLHFKTSITAQDSSTVNGITGLVGGAATDLGLVAGDYSDSTNNATAASGVGIFGVNKTAGTGAGGSIKLWPGTSSGGAAGSIKMPRTVTAGGTTTVQVIDKPSGRINIAGTESSKAVTNSSVTATSFVNAIAQTNDSVCSVKNVVPGVGTFTINMTGACNAETAVAWWVTN